MSTARRVSWLLALNIAFVLAFGWFADRFEAHRGPGVLDLELSFTPGAFRQILLAWAAAHPTGVGVFKTSVLLLDFLFPVAYAAFLTTLYVWVVTTGGGRPLLTGRIASWVAAGLDWVENVLLLVLLGGVHDADSIRAATFSPRLVGMMSTTAAVKLAFLLVPAALTLVAVFMGPRGRVLRLARFSSFSVALGSLPLIVVAQGQDLLVSLADPATSGPLVWTSFFAFLLVWAGSVWYWARVLLMMRFAAEEPAGTGDEGVFARNVPRVLGTATLALAAVAFLRASRTVGSGSRPVLWMLTFAGVCIVQAWLFWMLVVKRRPILKGMGVHLPPEPPYLSLDRPPQGTLLAAVVSLTVSLVFFTLFWRLPLRVAPALGAGTILLIAAANTVFLGSMAVLLGRWRRLPVVTLALIGAAVFSYWNDNHDVRLARTEGRLATASLAGRPHVARAFREWFAERQSACRGCAEVPVYLVAAEGGGIRAAYWAAIVLTHLTDQRSEFAPRIFAISGVSGGSVGAAVYAALVRDASRGPLPCAGVAEGRPSLEPCAARILSGPFLAPTLAKLVAPDLAQWFVPAPIRSFDRGRALEDAWAVAYGGATGRKTLAEPFLDVWPGPSAGVPALLLNGTHVQTGRRVLASPFAWTSRELPDTEDLLALLGADVSLTTAAHNSARFPYVSPAGRLRTADGQDRGHVVDGGYFENSGAATLHDVLHAIRADLSADPLPAPAPRFVVLYLCNDPDLCHLPTFEPGSETGWRRAANLAEWFSPLRALLGSRGARGRLALAELRRETGADDFVELGVCRRLVGREREAPLPLGWQISQGVRSELDRQARDPVCGGAPVP